MHFLLLSLILTVLSTVTALRQQTDWSAVANVIQQAIGEKAFPGCVIGIANKTNVIKYLTYGHYTYDPSLYSLKTAENTKYDVASITKIQATTLAIMNLVSSNSIQLTDLVSKYIQNYDTNKKGNTTIANLMLHNAGLPYDYPGALPKTQGQVIDYIRFIKPVYPVGSKMQYSNLGFLLLSLIVQKITGKTFAMYTSQNRIFAGLRDTGFNPSFSQQFYRIAPTQYDHQTRKRIVRGEAHQRLAYFFNGIAGHSGYFTTAPDLLRYMRILMNYGKLPEQIRTLPEDIIKQFITRVELKQYINTRGYGFDTVCPSSKMTNCVGHDGSTGVTAFADLDKNVAFVILSNRGHPNVNNNLYFQKYKVKISDAIMEALGY